MCINGVVGMSKPNKVMLEMSKIKQDRAILELEHAIESLEKHFPWSAREHCKKAMKRIDEAIRLRVKGYRQQ